MAIKTTPGRILGTEGEDIKPGNNAMIIEIIRTALIYYFNGEVAILLEKIPESILHPHRNMAPGLIMQSFQEKEELQEILAGDGDSYMLETITETVRVVARFFV